MGFTGRTEKVRLGTAAMDILYYAARQLMKQKLPFNLENNFEEVSRPGLVALLEEYAYYPVTVLVTGEYSVLYESFVRRNGSQERHRGHVVNYCYPEPEPGRVVEPMSYEEFVTGFSNRGMDSFSVEGPRIVVDTTDFS